MRSARDPGSYSFELCSFQAANSWKSLKATSHFVLVCIQQVKFKGIITKGYFSLNDF